MASDISIERMQRDIASKGPISKSSVFVVTSKGWVHERMVGR